MRFDDRLELRNVSTRSGNSAAWVLAWSCVLWGTVASEPAFAADSPPEMVQISEARLGFDGAVQRRTFLPLTFEARNLSPVPWSGKVRITRGTGRGQRLGEVVEIPISLQPDETRWVQAVVYVIDEFEEWLLQWGPNEQQQYRLTNLQVGPRPTVLVYDTDAVTPATGILRRLPEQSFPTSVTATASLRGIVLAHVPFWQGARARAFFDWLGHGGRLYILHNDRGEFPVFPQALEMLNRDQPRFSIGLGTVQRIPISLKDLTLDDARARIFNDELPTFLDKPADLRGVAQFLNSDGGSSWLRDQILFGHLSELAKFERRWWLMALAVCLYLLVLFPGCYRLGRGARDVRPFYAAFFGAVLGFSVVFAALGQLGGGTPARLRSAAIAQSLGNQRYLVTQWSHLAAVEGREYRIAHALNGTWYSTCQESESVDGVVTVGTESAVSLTMPPASGRTLLHTGTVSRQVPDMVLDRVLAENGRIEQLDVSINGCCSGTPHLAIVVYRGSVYRLAESAGKLTLDRKRPVVPLLQELNFDYRLQKVFSPFRFLSASVTDPDVSRNERYRDLSWQLIGNAFGLSEGINSRQLKLHDDVVRVMVAVPMSEEYFSTTTDFPDQEGAVLFVHDFRIPGGSK